jgi:hypothetical protein
MKRQNEKKILVGSRLHFQGFGPLLRILTCLLRRGVAAAAAAGGVGPWAAMSIIRFSLWNLISTFRFYNLSVTNN